MKMLTQTKLLSFLCLCIIAVYGVQCELTITIIGSNDIHGKAFPTTLVRSDTGEKYNYGGLVYMASLIQILNNQNPGNTIYLDAGDQFQGGIQSSKLISSGQIMNDFYETIGSGASSIGNHQFDFGPQFLFPYMKGRQSKNLAGNLRSQTGQIDFLPNQKSSMIYQFANGIKLGVIGLSTLQTPSSTSTFSNGKFPSYRFLEYRDIIMSQNSKLRRAGANAVIILSHIGDACSNDFTYKNRTKDTVQQECLHDEISQIIDQLPQGTINGIIQGHRHKIAHHYYKGIPYIGSINGGYYINALYLKFNNNKQPIDSLIEGPIPVCERVFKNIGRCNYLNEKQLASAGQLVNWKFHGKNVTKHNILQQVFDNKWKDQMTPYFEQLVINQVQLRKQDTKQSELANLYTNLIHQAAPHADFVIVNSGGFRSEWLPGVLQFQHFYNMFPFQNILQMYQISGAELLQMLRIIQSGSKGFYHCWNIQTRATYQNSKRGFVSARFMNGQQIDPSRTYRGVSEDFLLNGGDDFKDVINKVYTPRNLIVLGQYKSVIQPYLIDMKVIKANSLIDPQNPRLIVN